MDTQAGKGYAAIGTTEGAGGEPTVTEAEWLNCTDPWKMLEFLRDSGRLTERKARWFAVACGRKVWSWLTHERSRQAVEVSEQYAEGLVGQKALNAVRRNAFAATKSPPPATSSRYEAALRERGAIVALDICMNTKRYSCFEMATATAGCANGLVFHVQGDTAGWAGRKAQCDLIRCIFGNPARPVTISPSIRAWNDAVVVRLAQAAYAERHLPEGTLDPVRLAVLADALEEAGCTDTDILGH